MENPHDHCILEPNADRLLDECSVSPCGYRLFDRKRSIHQIMGGGKAADVILWKRRRITVGIIFIATVAWLVFEWAELPLISVSSNVLLVSVVIQFLWANYAVLRNKQLQPLPELELSEEMVSSAAASFRVKINYMLLMAHDITLGKDFKLFFKVVVCLWLLSVIGSFFSFFTIAYVGTIVSITLPALYSKYDEHIDRYAGLVHRKFSKHYKVVDENVINRIPRITSKDKDA
ncbi:hypothetical protein ACHQM5_020639 [Ranunculus cassubicifolius]